MLHHSMIIVIVTMIMLWSSSASTENIFLKCFEFKSCRLSDLNPKEGKSAHHKCLHLLGCIYLLGAGIMGTVQREMLDEKKREMHLVGE